MPGSWIHKTIPAAYPYVLHDTPPPPTYTICNMCLYENNPELYSLREWY